MCFVLGNNSNVSECIAAGTQARMQKAARSVRHHHDPRRLEDDYFISSQVLGSGCNGDVVLATSKTDADRKFAVKSLRIPNENEEDLRQLRQEVDIHLSLDHPHVARLFDVYESQEKLHLVMECMEGGELFDRLAAKKKFSEEEARAAVHQILLVLNYLHSHGVVHRDVKLENLIFDREGSEHLKLIDFGFSAKWSPVSGTNMDEIAGTLHYMAPEVLSGKNYTSQCDLWSLGVIAFTLLSGTMPFLGSQFKMINSIRNGAYSMQPRVWNDISDEAKSFIKSLINTNPTQRLSAKAAHEHPWIRQAQRKVPLDIVEVLETLRDFGGASKFRRNCLQMLALFLPNEDQAKVRHQFLWLAGYEQGAITMEKLSEAISEQFKVVGESEALQIFRAFGLEQNQEMQFSDFLVAMLGERIQLNGKFVASAFHYFGQQSRGSISREGLLAILDSEELEDRFVETELQNSDGQVNVTDLVAYSLDNSWKRANLVQKKRNMMSLRNMFSAWKKSKLAKESSFEQQHDVVESNILDAAHNSEKHAELVSTCRSMMMSPQFTSTFKKHIAIRREIGKLAKESITEQQHDMVESNRHDVAHNSENHAELMSTFRSMLMSAEFASTFKRHVALSEISREISFLGW